jgi:hypothetical protein
LEELQLGVTFGFYAKNGYFATDQARREVDEMASSGIKWVVVTPTVAQETYSSTIQFRDFELTPSDYELTCIIEYIKSKGMHVQLRPMLETLDGLGRLQIWFPADGERIPGRVSNHWGKWFESMKKRAVHYAKIAQQTGCELYGLDSELDRTVNQNQHWKEVIAAVRSVYDGPVTSCHTTHTVIVDFDSALEDPGHWFFDLDLLSLSCYHPAAHRPHETLTNMIENFASQKERFRRYAALYKKPILFGECGCTSSAGGAISPSGWSNEAPYDGLEQANYLEAVLRSFWDEPWWYGLYWWKWDEQNVRPAFRGDPAGDKGFTIKGKPAQEVFARWSKKDRTKIHPSS